MKKYYASMALLAGAAVACSSCVSPAAGYATYSAPVAGGVVSTGVSWTNASYDADGFPIFGYYYGRPVYGYTSAGVAIFSIAALTALCYVPHWGPASWYHGHHHYPKGIHRVPAPPRFPKGHRPAVRPAGAHNPPPPPAKSAPRTLPAAPGRAVAPPVNNNRGHVSAPRPMPAAPGKAVVPPVNRGGSANVPRTLPAAPGRAVAPVPSVNRGGSANVPRTLPAAPGKAVAPVPSVNHGSSANVPRTLPAAPGRLVMPTPSASSSSASRPVAPVPSSASSSSSSRHSGGGFGGGSRGGHGGGGHGGGKRR